MKLFHLSDLHLGKRLNEYSLIDDQKYILEQILGMLDSEKPQAVMISGDVYDKSVPTVEAVALFDDFLCRLSERSVQVFVISGNHDSAERLSFGSRLMEHGGIHISGSYNGVGSPITLTDDYGEVDFFLLPFVRPSEVRAALGNEDIVGYDMAVREAVKVLPRREDVRSVLLCHQFVTGALRSDSETVSVGGTDNVDVCAFEGFDYVALGHIHREQNIGSERVRYCGTPLKYSISEQYHEKSLTVVELHDKGLLDIRTLPLIPKRQLRSVRGTLEQLTERSLCSEDYVYAVLTDETDLPDAMPRLRAVYPNLMGMMYDNSTTKAMFSDTVFTSETGKDELDYVSELYAMQNGRELSDTQLSYLKTLIDEIREED